MYYKQQRGLSSNSSITHTTVAPNSPLHCTVAAHCTAQTQVVYSKQPWDRWPATEVQLDSNESKEPWPEELADTTTAAPSATRAAAASHGTTDSRKGGSRRKAVAAVARGGGGSAFLSTVKLQQARHKH